jgi:hypothetical protein
MQGMTEAAMKTFGIRVAAIFAIAMLPWTPVEAKYEQRGPGWCGNSGYDAGPPRERGPGTGPFWSGEPTDCRSIWRHAHYRGTDPDPHIRLQLMRGR